MPNSKEPLIWRTGSDFCFDMVGCGESCVPCVSEILALNLTLSERGRNSDEAVLDDLDNCGRCPLSRGTSIDAAFGKVGDTGGGGLLTSKLTGLMGM